MKIDDAGIVYEEEAPSQDMCELDAWIIKTQAALARVHHNVCDECLRHAFENAIQVAEKAAKECGRGNVIRELKRYAGKNV